MESEFSVIVEEGGKLLLLIEECRRVLEGAGELRTIEGSGVMEGMFDMSGTAVTVMRDSSEGENCCNTGDDIVAWIKPAMVPLVLTILKDSAFSGAISIAICKITDQFMVRTIF